MGDYFIVVNRTKREFANPEKLHPEHGIKLTPVVLGPFGNLMAWAVLCGPWHGDAVHLLGDYGEEYWDLVYHTPNDWTDVTQWLRERMDQATHGGITRLVEKAWPPKVPHG